jgi:hypothetical protein
MCGKCSHTFGWRNKANKYVQQRIWFKRWIIEGYTVRQLAQQSGHSMSTIGRLIRYWLERPPTGRADLSRSRHLILDGTFLERRRGVFAVMDAERTSIIYSAHNTSEGPTDMQRICTALVERETRPKSATVDGNKHLIRIMKIMWPNIVIQRCLVHIQRQGLSWCRRYPKRTDAKRLRELFLHVMAIQTTIEQKRFVAQVRAWERRYGAIVAHSSERSYVRSDLKRARSMLLGALPSMFHYLDDPRIPKSTNALEGYFARLKQRYRQHRGLAVYHRQAYFAWYFHLCPK